MEVLYTLKKKESGYHFRTQCYERFQVILVLHNELRIESNGNSGRLHPGDIALLRNGSAFSLSCHDGGYEGVGVELLRAEHAVFHGPAWWGHAGVVSLAMGRELKEQMERYQVTSHEYFHHLAVSFAWNSAMTDQTDRSENYPPQVWTERIKHPGEKFKKGDVVEAVVLKDIARCGRLLAEFITRLKPDYMETFRWDKE